MGAAEVAIRVEEMRQLQPELLEALVAIEQEAFGKGGMNEWFLPPFARYGRVYVLWVEGDRRPAGVAECMVSWQQPQCVYLFGISIRKCRRGQGLGTRFLQEIIGRLQAEGFQALELTVSPGNAAALRLYQERLGFRTIAFHKEEYGPGEDRLLLRLDLAGESAAGGGTGGEGGS
ncbi:MAG: GNAT family N-acetyltransferase [Firmicutes bacterium]|nr:GNAT family N-acetyltransferase [Bacillota bacterium]